MDELNVSTVNAEPVVNVEPQETEQIETVTEPVNAGSEEVATPQTEKKPVQDAETNAHFAEVRRKAEAEARDKLVDEMYGAQGIHTYAEYQEAVRKQEQAEREQAIRDEYESKGLPDELVEELVASKRDREEREAEKKARAEHEKQQAEYQEFFNYFRDENGRDFNSNTDQIPQEVWDMVNKGKTLTDAYAIHHTKELKAKIAELEGRQKAEATNQINAASSTGSLTGNGSADNGFISFENFEANKHDQKWVIKNLSKIQESRVKW